MAAEIVPIPPPLTVDPEKGVILREGVLSIQVCVPSKWDDAKVKDFADGAYLCGTTGGWFVTKVEGYARRVPCSQCADRVHIVLNC